VVIAIHKQLLFFLRNYSGYFHWYLVSGEEWVDNKICRKNWL